MIGMTEFTQMSVSSDSKGTGTWHAIHKRLPQRVLCEAPDMYAHYLPGQEMRRLCRGLYDGRERTLAGLTRGLGTARALPAMPPDLRELLCLPRV